MLEGSRPVRGWTWSARISLASVLVLCCERWDGLDLVGVSAQFSMSNCCSEDGFCFGAMRALCVCPCWDFLFAAVSSV